LSPAPLTITESSQVLGRFRYVERELHRRIGVLAGPDGLAGGPVPARARVWLAGASMAHSWRAEQIRPLLPVSAGLPGAEELTRSPGPQVDEVLDLATSPSLKLDSLLAGLVEVIYASMIYEYRQRLAAASPACDPPVVRVLGRLATDLESARAGGERLIGGWPDSLNFPGSGTKGAPRGSEQGVDRLRASVIRAGGIFGSLHY